ncbi:MAG: phospholipase D-like domain-containing protein [Rhodoblastus sp.]
MARALSLAAATLVFALADPPVAAREPTFAGVRLYYSPAGQTVAYDIEAFARARVSIDMAAYVLSDRGIIEALGEAARRGVKVRLYLDDADRRRTSGKTLDALTTLAATSGVAIRRKAAGRDPMHLKSYLIDRRTLRTGSANFSYTGGRFQDNDVLMVESPALAETFARNFEAIWDRPDNTNGLQ